MKSVLAIVVILSCLSCSSPGQSPGGGGGGGGGPTGGDQGIVPRPVAREAGSAVDAGAEAATVEGDPEMLPVPGGTFTMGSDDPRADADERPAHAVTLPAFLLDRTETTNAAYSVCVASGACRKPAHKETEAAGFEPLEVFRTLDRPVTAVSQSDAAAYCAWRGGRLPTEAELERAARGDDGRIYAWGDREPALELAVYDGLVTAPVGSRPAGAGPYGHLDLAGNVWEWTADHYDPLAYERPGAAAGIPAGCDEILRTQDRLRAEGKEGFTGSNPIPKECEHSLRGGAFNYFARGLRASNRVHHPGGWRM